MTGRMAVLCENKDLGKRSRMLFDMIQHTGRFYGRINLASLSYIAEDAKKYITKANDGQAMSNLCIADHYDHSCLDADLVVVDFLDLLDKEKRYEFYDKVAEADHAVVIIGISKRLLYEIPFEFEVQEFK